MKTLLLVEVPDGTPLENLRILNLGGLPFESLNFEVITMPSHEEIITAMPGEVIINKSNRGAWRAGQRWTLKRLGL